ncbi:neuroendocrine convertase 1-like [Danaus plexippus]|uniref:neuroendocrine convertase 1-like n=1 Tax=Danaus plexippus TaxID=13037 RepID=UPI002AAFE4E6|nr:neuroendocrine convertase 1-like [Danaus plexippus]
MLYHMFVCLLSLYPVRSDLYVPYHSMHDGRETANSYDGEWIVEVVGGEEVAQLVALEHGYKYEGPVLGLANMYAFHAHERKERRTPSKHTSTLRKDRRIRWAEQLFAKSRVKRYPYPDLDGTLKRVKRIDEYTRDADFTRSSTVEHGRREVFNDELWAYEWYLQDTRDNPNVPRLDLNVLSVYNMGYNGRGVRVSILDDGVEHNHTDLQNNYDPEISWDCNDGDSDPYPRHDDKNRNSHGTRCAGEIAMTANNKKCGVGVAWGAKVGGVRMLDGRITDHVEGEAIGFAWDKVDIYSASWGPNDDGETVEGPGRLAMEAFKRGVQMGRNGKGNIFVWANGNGGTHDDNCNCDGYSSSMYTISIASASQQGLFPWYGEICSSTLATAYSSGAYRDQKIATTDVNDSCTLGHTGTSAAAPLAAGIIALMLDANPNLTWRDVQHLIVWTSEYTPLSDNPGWQVNGAGLYFDVRFGFGLLNAGSLVNAALNWTTVPSAVSCRIDASPIKGKVAISAMETVDITVKVSDCEVNYLEHVELYVNIEYTRRGALEIHLISPQGTMVQLLSPRPRDTSKVGFVNWPLTSVATWGERANGLWRVIVQDKGNKWNTGYVGELVLIVHGTKEMPAHMRSGPRRYDDTFSRYEIESYEDEPAVPGDHEHGGVASALLDQADTELQRNYHSRGQQAGEQHRD